VLGLIGYDSSKIRPDPFINRVNGFSSYLGPRV